MNLIELFGPTLTLKELCQILKISRTSYYNYTNNNEKSERYKENFPTPMPGYNKKLFITGDVENYLSSFQSVQQSG